MSRLTPFGFLFGKSLNDLVRGIRRHPDPEQRAEYLRERIAECRDEVRSPDLDIKSTAVLKLAYLEMLGYDMAWAGFHVTEVMASPHFQQKRVGYLAAMQSFRSDSELLMLVTNLLKMDLVSQNIATVGIALSGLATIVTPLLAADVSDDIMRMLSHSKPYIRQKAVLALHNVVLQYPEVLPVALQRMADLLDQAQLDYTDTSNISVISATVSVICELATHADSTADFLELTPKLYAIFTTSQHNWTLIKLLKIFQLFTKHEPRLKSRLLPAIKEVLATTEATSLIYECMNCILLGRMLDPLDYDLGAEIVKHAINLMERNDPNLTFISTKILELAADVNPQFLQKSVVFELLKAQQPDPVTRKHVLHLAAKVVDDDSFYDIVNELMKQFRTATTNREYRLDVAACISKMSASHNYEFVPDFQWLISDVFSEICREVVDTELSNRLLDIAVRVKDSEVRELVSQLCYELLVKYVAEDAPSATGITAVEGSSAIPDSINTTIAAGLGSTKQEQSSSSLDTCWWIIGEFPTQLVLQNPLEFIRRINKLPVNKISPAVVTSVAKIVSKLHRPENIVLDAAIDFLTPYSFSLEFELQERACQFLELLKLARSSPEQAGALVNEGLASLFVGYDLTPIAPGSQQKIKPPADLDLVTPIEVGRVPTLESQLELDSSSESEWEPQEASYGIGTFESSRSISPAVVVGGGGGTEGSGSDLHLQEQEQQQNDPNKILYNLSLLDSMRQNPDVKLPGLSKPTKKKVVIATDETVGGEDPTGDLSRAITAKKPANKPSSSIFKSGFRGPTSQLIEPEIPASSSSPPPVKVKHKKKKKSKAPKETPNEAPNEVPDKAPEEESKVSDEEPRIPI